MGVAGQHRSLHTPKPCLSCSPGRSGLSTALRLVLSPTSSGARILSSAGTQTTNLASISKSRLSALPIPLAPRDQAVRIVQAIEDAFARIRTLERECQRAERLLENFERTILNRGLEGRLIPQEPNDEPATVLLQRLRDARSPTNWRTGPAPTEGASQDHSGEARTTKDG